MTGRRSLWRKLAGLCLTSGIVIATACAPRPQPQHLPKVEVELGGRKVAVEVARTPEQRATGMMFRRKLAADEGMLFVFPRDQVLSFYMKDTPAPVSIAFIRADGTIPTISHMEPFSLEPHGSRLVCRYALEMPRGWFEKHGVAEGSKVLIPSDLAAE